MVLSADTPRTAFLSLDYGQALASMPDMLGRLHLPTLRPWKRGKGEAAVPAEGIGRHSDLLKEQRQRRGSVRDRVQDDKPFVEPRGRFDRSGKSKAIPLGATGAA